MNGDWLGAALLLATLPFTTEHRHPLRPWQEIGSAAWVFVTNADTVRWAVSVRAPDVDAAERSLGIVEPGAEGAFRLPYADTRVHLLINGDRVQVLAVGKPEIHYAPPR